MKKVFQLTFGCASTQKLVEIYNTHKQVLSSQWMIAQIVERLLCSRQTRVQIPALAPYEITL